MADSPLETSRTRVMRCGCPAKRRDLPTAGRGTATQQSDGCALAAYISSAPEARYPSNMTRLWLVFALLPTVACGGDDADGTADSGNMTCAPDEVAIEGSVDGEAVSYRGALESYAWTQLGSGELDVSFEERGSFHAEWPQLVGDGATFSATGSITLPATVAHSGETLGYGAGTFTKLDGGVRFKVSGFKLSVQCITAPCPSEDVEGTLRGCIEPNVR
jgi:hypothetical protein